MFDPGVTVTVEAQAARAWRLSRFSTVGEGTATARAARAIRPKEYIMMTARSVNTEDDGQKKGMPEH
jgi:hypothetical protein